jgi:hypothetical protein
MKILIWTSFAFIALLWSGAAWGLVALTQAAAQAAAAGAAADIVRQVTQWPLPAWLSLWVDTAWVLAAQQALAAALDTMHGAWPHVAAAAAWVVPLIWLFWGAGLTLLLLLAGGLHVLVARGSHTSTVTSGSPA